MVRSLVFACLLAASTVAQAQYPSRPILLVVPYTAGSDADLAARNLALNAPRYLNGQSVVVMNQPGASGAIGTLAVRNAPPDGYRLLLSRIAAQVILPATDRKTLYGSNDFTFLSLLEMNPYVCAVRSDAPYASMKDLVAEIRRQPGKLNFATVGEGTLQNFGPQYLFSLVGLPKDAAVGVPYKGSGELTASLLGGHVQFAVPSAPWGGQRPSLAPYVTVTGPKDGATAAGGRSCYLSSRRCPESFLSGSQRWASQIRENGESGGSIARGVLAEYRVQAVLTQVRLANMPGEGPTLGSNRYSPEQGELVEQRASAVSDTGERIVANRDREVSLLV